MLVTTAFLGSCILGVLTGSIPFVPSVVADEDYSVSWYEKILATHAQHHFVLEEPNAKSF